MKRLGIALAATLAVVGGVLVAVDDKGAVITDDVVEKAVALKMAGVRDARTVDVDAKERDARTIRTDSLTLLVADDATWTLWGEAYCAPLVGEPEHARCLAANAIVQGVPMCVADKPAGRVARIAATRGQAERWRAVKGIVFAEPESLGWSACPE